MYKWLLSFCALLGYGQTYDLVIQGGRVIDPESSLDGVRNIGIRGGLIATVTTQPLQGKRAINAKGLVVAPGFIDLHAHGQDYENHALQAQDGVTTALELEIGAGDVERWYAEREGKRLINSGVTVGHVPIRMRVLKDPNPGFVPSGDGARRAATEEEITLIKRGIEQGLQQGALGLGFGIQYTPAASRWEILEAFRVAGRFKAPVFVHIRHMGQATPDAMTALEEVIAAAAVTGAPLHVVHITSSGLSQTPQLLQTIAEARAHGLDVTTECYPYNAAMTELQSAMFDPGWQKVLGIGFDRLEWTATGERLNESTFTKYRKQGGMVIMHMIPDPVVERAVSEPGVMIASDGYLHNGKGHPRGAGTYARVLGLYVRQKQTIPLMEAVRKMSLLPANRVGLKKKGRLRVGADADLAIFDPQTVSDRATFQQPAVASTGIPWVVVNGVPVVAEGQLQRNLYPGKAVKR
ncbi:MAG: amidohydrolase family protein [Bryobacterales bacterium]|nr:amidohydrolase family protein [Bryobacterales bacterium]